MRLRIVPTHWTIWCLLAGTLQAQTYEQVAPQTLPVAHPPTVDLPEPTARTGKGDDQQVLAPALNGLVFVASQDAVIPNGRSDRGVVVESLPVRWTPKVGQVGSLTQSQKNDPHVQETTSA